jgi:hypothetical protein
MTSFADAVVGVQALIGESLEDSTHVAAKERVTEAERVAPCAERFVAGELDPTRELTVARTISVGALGTPPSLAEKLGRKLDAAAPETREATANAVYKALAIGYLAYVETEPRTDIQVVNRDAADIWEWWALNCRVMLENTGIPKSWADTVRGLGRDLLIGELKGLRLTRWLGGSKLNQLGMTYAQAGVHLRLAQTDALTQESFERGVALRREDPERPWRYDDYPASR